MMNALAVLFAAPAAEAVVGLARSGVAAAAEPFEALLKAAAQRARSSDSSTSGTRDGDAGEEGESIRQRLADKLQSLLATFGGVASDVVTLRFDEFSGSVKVGADHPLASALEAEIAEDPQFVADMGRLAEMEGSDSEWQFETTAAAF
jgi:hypothetical protein